MLWLGYDLSVSGSCVEHMALLFREVLKIVGGPSYKKQVPEVHGVKQFWIELSVSMS